MIKKVLITGGNKGIGQSLTKMFLDLNYEVFVVARDFENFLYKKQTICFEYDLTNIDDLSSLVEKIGKVDILINNAGVMYTLPFDDYPSDKIEDMLNINLKTPIKLIELCVKKGTTRVVNNASVAAYTGHPDIWYGVTKAGLINMTKSFAKLYEGRVILNAVAASPVDTDTQNSNSLERKEAFKKSVITKRFATVDEVAKTMLWLAIESPEYINGVTIDINNGSYLR